MYPHKWHFRHFSILSHLIFYFNLNKTSLTFLIVKWETISSSLCFYEKNLLCLYFWRIFSLVSKLSSVSFWHCKNAILLSPGLHNSTHEVCSNSYLCFLCILSSPSSFFLIIGFLQLDYDKLCCECVCV